MAPDEFEHQRDATGVCRACNRCSDPLCCGPTDEPCTARQVNPSPESDPA